MCTGLFRQLPELVHVGEIRVVTHGGCRALLVQLVGQCPGLLFPASVMDHNIPAASVQGFCCVGTQAVGCASDQGDGIGHGVSFLIRVSSVPQ